MPAMSAVETAFCTSAPWRAFAGRVLLPWALQGARPSGDVLEIGGGSGAMAEQLLRRHPDVRLTAADVDPRMVALATKRLGGRASATCADATALPFPDASFDLVLSFLMLHHVITWPAAIAEAARVLRPGGALVGYDLLDRRGSRLLHRLDRSPHRLLGADELTHAFAANDLHVERTSVDLLGQAVRFVASTPS